MTEKKQFIDYIKDQMGEIMEKYKKQWKDIKNKPKISSLAELYTMYPFLDAFFLFMLVEEPDFDEDTKSYSIIFKDESSFKNFMKVALECSVMILNKKI